jgi:DNA-binding SARP family transcriptional activator
MQELLTLGTFGLRARDVGESEAILVQPKRLALLVYLALAGRRRCRRRDQVVALFWPELDPQHARGALSQALRHLRRSLGEGVLICQGEEEIGIDHQALWCDAVAFREACAAREFASALGCYKGKFLEGFFIPDAAAEFDQWMDDQRTGLHQQATRAAAALVESSERASERTAAVEWAREAVRLAPIDETAVARLITLLDRSGDRAGALSCYDAFRKRMDAELQAAPAPETQALVASIRRRQR